MTITLYRGHVLEQLAKLPADSVHCIMTSPPYHGLRDYGTGSWEGGDAECDHVAGRGGHLAESVTSIRGGGNKVAEAQTVPFLDICRRCSARRVDHQIGLEPTIDEYIAKMVEVGRALRRVLRPDGVMFWNHGDNFCDKQLQGQPWRVAFALQNDGWWLRSDIIWAKPNPMPESCSDRPTKSHEYIFLLTKSPQYFWDQETVREPNSDATVDRASFSYELDKNNDKRLVDFGKPRFANQILTSGRNIRTVWNIATHAFPESHFATFPPKLVETCVKAGTSAKGCCPACGAPWVRVISTEQIVLSDTGGPVGITSDGMGRGTAGPRTRRHDTTTGWRKTCACPSSAPVPATVLDPFAGSGTTLMVADRLQRNAIGVDLNTKYAEMAVARIEKDGGLFANVSVL